MTIKATGIVRRVDDLGRIVIPMELRRTLGIGEKESLEIFVDDDRVILRVYRHACIFCSDTEDTTMYKDKLICCSCRQDLQQGAYGDLAQSS
jgi:transcriptional pleiotropic regulator of transition state genes